MDQTTHLPPAVRAALVALSQGSCDFPGCRAPVMVFLGNEPEVNVEPVRIRGAGSGEPDSFDDLLLLCVPHRKAVGRDPAGHPAELLRSWKQSPPGPLSELRDLTEKRLDALLTTAFAEAREQIDEALTAFEKSDPAAAQLLRELIDTLHDHRSRYGADPRLAGSLTALTGSLAALAGSLTAVDRKMDGLLRQLEEKPSRPPRINVGWRAPASAG
ncbi:hypothetical protein [Actinoplanes sp. OR16]|uniref:hypothetical protein n=1 Tax=Actinoplanes sp. OR16 TaxID=946334 RepID=UPI000FDC4FC9|nr:hypothetical protein [Actinoplanes sp. OR16]